MTEPEKGKKKTRNVADYIPNPVPFADRLLDATAEGKVKWEPTANKNEFLATIGRQSFRLRLTHDWEFDTYSGEPEQTEIPMLELLDDKGKTLWSTGPAGQRDLFWSLYHAAQRVANQVDERLDEAMKALDEL